MVFLSIMHILVNSEQTFPTEFFHKAVSRSGIEPDGLAKPVSVVFDAASYPV